MLRSPKRHRTLWLCGAYATSAGQQKIQNQERHIEGCPVTGEKKRKMTRIFQTDEKPANDSKFIC